RRAAAAPGFQSNCFIGAMGEAVGVDLELDDADGLLIATAHYDLTANQFVRLLDVFSALGAPAGDYANMRAQFTQNSTGHPTYLGFCTVQNNTSFDADFRVAKSVAPNDRAKLFSTTTSYTSGTSTDLGGGAIPLLDGTNQH